MQEQSGKTYLNHQAGQLQSKRVMIVKFLAMAGFLLILIRAIIIHTHPPASEALAMIAHRQYQKHVQLSPYRGTIFDRRGVPLAISIRSPSLAINPKLFNPTPAQTQRLARLLKIPKSRIDKARTKDSYFAWIKRKIPHSIAKHIEAMDLKGIHLLNEPDRYYTSGSAASHIVGYVNIDDHGQSGIEQILDQDLRGVGLSLSIRSDAKGDLLILRSGNATPEKPGNSVYLTIDRAIQEFAEEALEQGVRDAKARSGFAIVADPHTGQILALANYPKFDPNDRSTLSLNRTRNRAVLDLFEPGSVMKPIVVSLALDEKVLQEQEVIDCEQGYLRIPGGGIHDDHPQGKLTPAETIIHSSNICTYKIAARLGKQKLYEGLKKFGFTQESLLLGLAGEQTGRLSPWQNWREIRFANIAFGQGVLVKALEIVQAYGSIANGGRLMRPYIVNKVRSPSGMVLMSRQAEYLEQILSPETADSMRKMLTRVTAEGTGRNAAIPGYQIAGKTGTAEKVVPGARGYSKDKRIANFVGFAPADDPHIVVYVVIDEPGRTPYYGGLWAAPVFRQITHKTLQYLNVNPSNIAVSAKDPQRDEG